MHTAEGAKAAPHLLPAKGRLRTCSWKEPQKKKIYNVYLYNIYTPQHPPTGHRFRAVQALPNPRTLESLGDLYKSLVGLSSFWAI